MNLGKLRSLVNLRRGDNLSILVGGWILLHRHYIKGKRRPSLMRKPYTKSSVEKYYLLPIAEPSPPSQRGI